MIKQEIHATFKLLIFSDYNDVYLSKNIPIKALAGNCQSFPDTDNIDPTKKIPLCDTRSCKEDRSKTKSGTQNY